MQHENGQGKFAITTHRLGAQVSITSGYSTERLNIIELRVLIKDLIDAQKQLERNITNQESIGGAA